MTDFVQRNSRDIELLSRELQNFGALHTGAKTELNRVQAYIRRKNVKIDGLKEDRGETPGGLVDKVVQPLNAYFTDRNFTHDSIEHAYRVGKRGRNSRPVIMCFQRYEDTMTVMKNCLARQVMFRDGIRVSPDLTPRQRDQMQQLREEGQRGYLAEGKIFTARNSRSRSYFRRYGASDISNGEANYNTNGRDNQWGP